MLRVSIPAVYGNQPLRVYKAQPHASASMVEMVCVAGFDPAAPRFQGECSTRLSYTQLMAILAGADPATFPVTGECSTVELKDHGVHAAIRTPTVQDLGLLPLPLGYVDVIGTPPGNRTPSSWVKKPAHCRYASGVWRMVNPGGYDPLEAGLKGRCRTILALLSGSRSQDTNLRWRAASLSARSRARLSVSMLSLER